MKLTVCELFAGVGGFRLGLEKSGWQTVWSNQYEPSTKAQHAAECYKKNFGKENFSNTDINTIVSSNLRLTRRDYEGISKTIPDHNLLVGGFPCQDYSVATSQAKGLQGKKGVLWWNIHNVIQVKSPKYILLENVDRLLSSPSSQVGRDFAVMLACLRENDYSVEWRMINAADYGFPQKRRRVFIFACKNSTAFAEKMLGGKGNARQQVQTLMDNSFFSKDFPVEIKNDQYPLFPATQNFTGSIQGISDTFVLKFSNAGFMTKEPVIHDILVEPKFEDTKRVLRDVLEERVDKQYYIDKNSLGFPDSHKDERVKKSDISDEQLKTWHYVKGAKHEIRTAKGYEFNYDEGAIPFPDDIDSPSRTMLTSEGSKNPNRTSHIIEDPYNRGAYRRLTPVECERLNGFPDNWTQLDGIPDSRRYFFMGNALVVNLIEKMGKRLREIIEEEEAIEE